MQRASKPSMGADCHWSSALPCGTPSATSIMTTVRARCFSASRCAAVAPTFPAPTTATLFSIENSSVRGRVDVKRRPEVSPRGAEMYTGSKVRAKEQDRLRREAAAADMALVAAGPAADGGRVGRLTGNGNRGAGRVRVGEIGRAHV